MKTIYFVASLDRFSLDLPSQLMIRKIRVKDLAEGRQVMTRAAGSPLGVAAALYKWTLNGGVEVSDRWGADYSQGNDALEAVIRPGVMHWLEVEIRTSDTDDGGDDASETPS